MTFDGSEGHAAPGGYVGYGKSFFIELEGDAGGFAFLRLGGGGGDGGTVAGIAGVLGVAVFPAGFEAIEEPGRVDAFLEAGYQLCGVFDLLSFPEADGFERLQFLQVFFCLLFDAHFPDMLLEGGEQLVVQ